MLLSSPRQEATETRNLEGTKNRITEGIKFGDDYVSGVRNLI